MAIQSATFCNWCNTQFNEVDGIDQDATTPELSLLVIDLGDSCVVKVEKGDPAKLFPEIVVSTQQGDTAVIHVPFTGFESVKKSIDALDDKPVPRIEPDLLNAQEFGYVLFWAAEFGGVNGVGTKAFDPESFKALEQLAGKPLPIYEPKKGEWKRLPDTSEYMGDPLESTGIKIWRYTRIK